MNGKIPTALVVDDNRICRVVAVTMLERFGFFAAPAENGREALAAVTDTTFSLILMDCDMPELDGLNTTLAIRQIEQPDDGHTLIIGVTSRANRQECLAVGMDDHIRKPLTMVALSTLLKRWGWQPILSRHELRETKQSLENGRQEINNQARALAEEHARLGDHKAQLSSSIWTGTSSEIAAQRRRLAEWEDALRERERVLATRERFLKRREQAAASIDEQQLAS